MSEVTRASEFSFLWRLRLCQFHELYFSNISTWLTQTEMHEVNDAATGGTEENDGSAKTLIIYFC